MTADFTAIRSEKLMKSKVAVGDVGGGRKTHPKITSNVGNIGFRDALEYSLCRAGIYSLSGDLLLEAIIIDENIRKEKVASRASVSVKEKVRYTIRERLSRKILFDTTIVSSGKVTILSNAKRKNEAEQIRRSKERAMKSNIEEFLAAFDRAFLAQEAAK